MKVTLSIIKADIGSIGGHFNPSERLLERVRSYVEEEGRDVILDFYVGYTGDDVAILMSHTNGVMSEDVHRLAWDAFKAGTEVAKEQGLYGAGQDLLVDAFSGNVRGMGPAVAEMEFEERSNEPFLMFAADKTDPGAYNLPLYLGFADPMFCPGLMLSPNMGKGFQFTIMDVSYTEGDRRIVLNSPEDLYDIATLLRDTERFVVEKILTRATGEIVASVSTTRLHNIAGKYTGKDDPVMLVRVQKDFPAAGEVLSPYAIGHYVAGTMRGSHNGSMMPVKKNSPVAYFDGPPLVNCLAFSIHHGKLTESTDVFDHPFWEAIREKVSEKAVEIRRQGFFGPAMLGENELEYTGITERLKELDTRFKVGMPTREEILAAAKGK